MVSITDDTADELEEIALEQEVELQEVRDVFKEKYEKIGDKSPIPESKVESYALSSTRSKFMAQNRVPTQEVEMLTIGGEVREWQNGDTFVGKALVDVEPEDGGRNFLSTVIAREDHLNLAEVYDAFSEVGNVVRGQFGVSDADIEGFRVLNSGEDSEIEVSEPTDKSQLFEEIRDEVPEFTISTVADNLSATVKNDDGEVWPASFGVDIRRITGTIYDGYKNPEEGNGTYTIRDETVFDEQDLVESPVYDSEEAGENATPGMTCWTNPDKMEYGTESICEFYGTVTQGDDGNITMNVDAILPIHVEQEFDGYTDESTDGRNEGQVESNVERTQI